VGNGGDGGIDCIYGFVNGELITEDSDVSQVGRDISLELFIIQSKFEASFSESAIDRLILSTRDLLDLSKPLDEFRDTFNRNLLNIFGNFRRVHKELALKLPHLKIAYYYCSKGSHIHPNVQRKVITLQDVVRELFSPCDFSFDFYGAAKLLELAHERPTTTFSLTVAENPISTGTAGFLCLVNLEHYYSFITDPNGQLQRRMLEANVRDYEGSAEVNQGIRRTLEFKEAEDFWWLNNGITVIATSVSFAGKTLTVVDPQVVNGLQTSIEIYNCFRNNPNTQEDRNLLVRVVVPTTEESRDRIIRYTNSQTRIPDASLRATDRIHRNVEMYFGTKGFYYDRRKNAHKNAGHPKGQIVSIPYLAQAVMAIVLQEPDNSRARPSSLIKRDRDYRRVFNDDYPIELFYECAKHMKKVEEFMRSEIAGYAQYERNNLKYHLAMFAVARNIGKVKYDLADLNNISFECIDESYLADCLSHVIDVFSNLWGDDKFSNSPDQVAKSREFVNALQQRLHEILN
jgi:hypothetical protein